MRVKVLQLSQSNLFLLYLFSYELCRDISFWQTGANEIGLNKDIRGASKMRRPIVPHAERKVVVQTGTLVARVWSFQDTL